MPIVYKKQRAVLKESVAMEVAEDLFAWLQKNPKGSIDLANCTHLHTAVLQVLVALRPAIAIWPKDEALRAWLHPVLSASKP